MSEEGSEKELETAKIELQRKSSQTPEKRTKPDTIDSMSDIIMKAPITIIIGLIVLGIGITIFSWLGLIFFGLSGIFFAACLKKIPAEPPHVGLVTIWGRRIPNVKKEGWVLLAPFFPFFYDVILIKVEKINFDFTFKDIRAKADPELLKLLTLSKTTEENESDNTKEDPKAGGEVAVNISMTFIPDYKSGDPGERLISYLNSGGEKGVEGIIKDLIEEDIREMGHDHTWEQITFSAGGLGHRLISKLTGIDKPIKDLRKELQLNGFPDVADLGIHLSRFNIGKVKEQGKLATAAEKFATEVQERRGAEIEMEFVRQQIEELINLGIDPGEAADVVQVEGGKSTKQVNAYRGLEIGKATENIGGSIVKMFLGGKKKND